MWTKRGRAGQSIIVLSLSALHYITVSVVLEQHGGIALTSTSTHSLLMLRSLITGVIVQNTILGREERVEGKIGRKGESKKDRSSEECECT